MMSEAPRTQLVTASPRGRIPGIDDGDIVDGAVLEALDAACRDAAAHDWKAASVRTDDAAHAAVALRDAVAAFVVASRGAGALPEQVLVAVRAEVTACLRRHGHGRDLFLLHDLVFAAFLSAYFGEAAPV